MCMVFSINTYAIHTNTSLINSAYLYNDPVVATVTTQNSVCLNSGIATIHATGGTTGTGGTVNYTYEVLTTPAGFTYNASMLNGNVLSGLAIGNYSLRVRDTAGAFIDVAFTIEGTPYINMQPTASTQLICNGVELVIKPGGDYPNYDSLGVPPYRYAITTELDFPQIIPFQTSNKFLVTPGLYKFMVEDSCGARQVRSFQVTQTAVQPEVHYYAYNSISNYTCNNGIINATFRLGNLRNQEGTSYGIDQPFHYKLYVDNVLAETDSITWWNDLYFTKYNYTLNSPIQYSLEATNKCGVTEMFTGTLIFNIPEPGDLEIVSSYGCDDTSMSVRYGMQYSTYELLDSNDVVIATNTYGTFSFTSTPGMVIGNSYKIREISCYGISRVTDLKVLSPPILDVTENYINCNYYYDFCYYTPAPNAFKLQLFLENDLNTVVAEKNGTAGERRGFSLNDSNAIVPGQNYVVKATDLVTHLEKMSTFHWRAYVNTPFVPGHEIDYQNNINFPSMYVNTVRVTIGGRNLAPGGNYWYPNVQIISGTATSLTKLDGTVIPMNYPLSGPAYNLPVGVYIGKLEGVYDCEIKMHTFQFEVTQDMVQEEPLYDNITFSTTTPCPPNPSIIQLSITNLRPKVYSNLEKFFYASLYLYNPLTQTKIYLYTTDGNNYFIGNTIGLTKNFTASVYGNISGDFKLFLDYHKYNSMSYETYGAPIPDGTRGDVVELGGTYVVKTYQQPKIESLIVNPCVDGTRNIVVVPEEGKGVAPYKYSILSGPNGYSAPSQTSAVFLGLQPGVYQLRLEDSCGNAVTEYLDVSNFVPPAFDTVGSSCEGEDVTFSFPNVPYYTYTWLLPNNTTHTGNILTINNLTASDAGLYTVTITSEVGGCTATVTKQYLLDPCYGLVDPSSKNARVNPNLRQRLRNAN